MRSIDHIVLLFGLLATLTFGASFYQYQTVLSSSERSEYQSRLFRSEKLAVFTSFEELGFLEAHYADFQKIVEGNGQKELRQVSWIKVLEAAKAEVGIAGMSFEIRPYQSVVSNLPDQKITIGEESIVLRVSLLHDGMLADLLNYFDKNAPTPFFITALEIERKNETSEKRATSLHNVFIEAEVTMKWHLVEVGGDSDAITG